MPSNEDQMLVAIEQRLRETPMAGDPSISVADVPAPRPVVSDAQSDHPSPPEPVFVEPPAIVG